MLVCTSPYKARGDIHTICPPCDYSIKGDVGCCRNCPKGSDYGCNSRCGWLEEKGETKTMITNIRIDAISPHPDNPRKDLGDLAELAASIKANGILQNLTVVPWFSTITRAPADDPKQQERMGYIVVIGHRRLAAAKLAGLTEVPCAISDMNQKQQVATMLLENMQRNDLTIWEQAQGFQMMLDFGESVGDISEQTGFSETTIRRRVKLLELDGDKFRDSVKRGTTLQDYAELDKIGSVELKNKVLEKIGTSDFKWALANAIDTEKMNKNRAAMIADLETFATRVDKPDGLRTMYWLYCTDSKPVAKPADVGETKYFFYVNGDRHIQLLTESSEPVGSVYIGGLSAEEQRQLQERRQRLDEINKRAAQLRDDFVRNYVGVKKHSRDIMELAVRAIFLGGLSYGTEKKLLEMLCIELPELGDDEDEDELMSRVVLKAFDTSPDKVLLVTAYCAVDSNESCYNWRGEFEANPALDALYVALERLGYETSADERALRDGTHELYVR